MRNVMVRFLVTLRGATPLVYALRNLPQHRVERAIEMAVPEMQQLDPAPQLGFGEEQRGGGGDGHC